MNFLLITIDALRSDRLSYLGYFRRTTPNIDSLSLKGVFFSQAISQSSHTPESFPAILASMWPLELKGNNSLPTEVTTIGEILKQVGYTTSAIHSNPYLSRAFNYDKGFDFFDDDLYLGSSKLSAFFKRASNYLKSRPHLTAEEINKKAISWLQKTGSSKFFLWLHYMDPHGPYQPPREYFADFGIPKHLSDRFMHKLWRRAKADPSSITEKERELLINLYDAEIKYVDSQIGNLIQELKNMDLFDNTLIVITSDHGEAFGEHGKYDHPRQLYEENIRVPMIFVCPSLLPKGIIVEEQVQHIDLVPTICELLGVNLSQEKKNYMYGHSFASLFFGGSEEKKPSVIISETSGEKEESDIVKFSVRTRGYKLIASFKEGKQFHEELYDLKENPNETKDLAQTEIEITEKLRTNLEQHIQEIYGGDWQFPQQREIRNKEVEDRLRSLGYLD